MIHPLTQWEFLLAVGPLMTSYWLLCIQVSIISFHLWCMLGGSVELKWRGTYFSSLRTKLILAPLGIPKWVWPSMNWYRMFFGQTSTLPSSMHWKPTKHGLCCIQNNQLPTKIHVEFEDDSNVLWDSWLYPSLLRRTPQVLRYFQVHCAFFFPSYSCTCWQKRWLVCIFCAVYSWFREINCRCDRFSRNMYLWMNVWLCNLLCADGMELYLQDKEVVTEGIDGVISSDLFKRVYKKLPSGSEVNLHPFLRKAKEQC